MCLSHTSGTRSLRKGVGNGLSRPAACASISAFVVAFVFAHVCFDCNFVCCMFCFCTFSFPTFLLLIYSCVSDLQWCVPNRSFVWEKELFISCIYSNYDSTKAIASTTRDILEAAVRGQTVGRDILRHNSVANEGSNKTVTLLGSTGAQMEHARTKSLQRLLHAVNELQE